MCLRECLKIRHSGKKGTSGKEILCGMGQVPAEEGAYKGSLLKKPRKNFNDIWRLCRSFEIELRYIFRGV